MIQQVGVGHGDVELHFILSVDHPARPVGVAGDFNEWDWTATLFEERAEVVEAVVTVSGGRQYQFRYRGANGTWFNDDRADDYVPNEFGGVNCLIDVTTDGGS